MRTNKRGYDYNRRTPIIPQLVKVCIADGGTPYIRPSDNKLVCSLCGQADHIDLMWETHLSVFRRGLAELQAATL